MELKQYKDFDQFNIMNEYIKNIVEDIDSQKMFIIKQKLKEIVGIEIDFQEELKRKFKCICVVGDFNSHTFFYNDGSIEGKRIVTFEIDDSLFDPKNLSFGYKVKYY